MCSYRLGMRQRIVIWEPWYLVCRCILFTSEFVHRQIQMGHRGHMPQQVKKRSRSPMLLNFITHLAIADSKIYLNGTSSVMLMTKVIIATANFFSGLYQIHAQSHLGRQINPERVIKRKLERRRLS